MPLALVGIVLLLLLGLAGFIWLTAGLFSLALHLAMAGIVGGLADAVVPGRLPWGWLGAILAGLVGSWLGVLLMGHVGPTILGVPIIPGFVGALILALGISAVGRLTSSSR